MKIGDLVQLNINTPGRGSILGLVRDNATNSWCSAQKVIFIEDKDTAIVLDILEKKGTVVVLFSSGIACMNKEVFKIL